MIHNEVDYNTLLRDIRTEKVYVLLSCVYTVRVCMYSVHVRVLYACTLLLIARQYTARRTLLLLIAMQHTAHIECFRQHPGQYIHILV